MPTTQLTLPVHLHDMPNFANFYSGKNLQLVQHLQGLATGQGEHFTYLWGTAKAGCTHLLQACCQTAHDYHTPAAYLSLAEQGVQPQLLDSLESLKLICLDDIEQVLGQADWEEALFHLYNRSNNGFSHLIIAAKQPPVAMKTQLKDLHSRLSAGLIFQVHALSDSEKRLVIKMRAAQRGLFLSADVCNYILHHYSRDMESLLSLLDTLDQASLITQRKLTIPFVKTVLAAEVRT